MSGLLSLGLAAYLSTALYVSSSTSTAGDIDLLADLGSTAHWPSNAVEALGNPLVKKGKNFVSDAREILFTPDHAGRTLMDEFVDVYKNRPDKVNICGIRINHALALFVAVRHLQPSLVVESGVNAGQSTYFIRAASPTTTIYAIDPEVNPICESIGQGKRWIDSSDRTKNFTGKNFVDIADLDWVALGKEDKVDPRKALVFIDDHLQVLHRLPALMKAGIRHVVVEDNYKIFEGATTKDKSGYTPKQLFALDAEKSQRGHLSVRNKGVKMMDATWLFNNIISYAEFPPLVPPIMAKAYTLTKRKEAGGFMYGTDTNTDIVAPILRPELNKEDMKLYRDIATALGYDPLLKDNQSYMQFMNYNQICYLELVPFAPSLVDEKHWAQV